MLILKADLADAQSSVTREFRIEGNAPSAISHTLVYKPHPFLLPSLHSHLHVLPTWCNSAPGAVIMADVCIVCLGDLRLRPEDPDADTDTKPIKTEIEIPAPLPVLPSEQRY